MAVFPLMMIPKANYHWGGIAFGASSKNRGDRRHAACDLVASPGEPVYAVERGIVMEVPKKAFFQETYTIVIRHTNFTIRYAELDPKRLVLVGDQVEEGQMIGVVGRNNKGRGMLHFEMYQGTANGPLSQEHNTEYLFVPPLNYMRRKDLLDPTPYLDRWISTTNFDSYQTGGESPNWSE